MNCGDSPSDFYRYCYHSTPAIQHQFGVSRNRGLTLFLHMLVLRKEMCVSVISTLYWPIPLVIFEPSVSKLRCVGGLRRRWGNSEIMWIFKKSLQHGCHIQISWSSMSFWWKWRGRFGIPSIIASCYWAEQTPLLTDRPTWRGHLWSGLQFTKLKSWAISG